MRENYFFNVMFSTTLRHICTSNRRRCAVRIFHHGTEKCFTNNRHRSKYMSNCAMQFAKMQTRTSLSTRRACKILAIRQQLFRSLVFTRFFKYVRPLITDG